MEWISVEVLMPEAHTPVLIFQPARQGAPLGAVHCAQFTPSIRAFSTPNERGGLKAYLHVSHWMPLPTLPSEARA